MNIDSFSSSSAAKYGWGPGFAPWTTLLWTLSCSVDLGMPCILAAQRVVSPPLTASSVATIAWSVHFFRFDILFGFNTGGADLDLGLPTLHFLAAGIIQWAAINKTWNIVLKSKHTTTEKMLLCEYKKIPNVQGSYAASLFTPNTILMRQTNTVMWLYHNKNFVTLLKLTSKRDSQVHPTQSPIV